MNPLYRHFFLLYIFFICSPLASQVTLQNDNTSIVIWQKIAPYFSVPEEFKEQYGTYTSPLRFYDGRPVVNTGDWNNRKEEILSRWHEMMGVWPPPVFRIDFLSKL